MLSNNYIIIEKTAGRIIFAGGAFRNSDNIT